MDSNDIEFIFSECKTNLLAMASLGIDAEGISRNFQAVLKIVSALFTDVNILHFGMEDLQIADKKPAADGIQLTKEFIGLHLDEIVNNLFTLNIMVIHF